MKRLFTAAALATSLAFGGCSSLTATLGLGTAQAASVVSTAKYDATVGVTACYNAQTAAAHTLIYAAQQGWVHGQSAADAKKYLDTALTYIHQADKDVKEGKDVADEISKAYGLIGQATAVVPTTAPKGN